MFEEEYRIKIEGSSEVFTNSVISVLSSLGAKIVVSGSDVIQATIGSYSNIRPSNAKRDVIVTLSPMNEVIVRISYFTYAIVTIISAIITLIGGVWLYNSALHSLEWLRMFTMNPFIMFLQPPPDLIEILDDFGLDINEMFTILRIFKIVSLLIIITDIYEFIELIIIGSRVRFEVVDITSKIVDIMKKTPNENITEKSHVNTENESKTIRRSHINCTRPTSEIIKCTIKPSVPLDEMKRLLTFLEFNPTHETHNTITFEKRGSIFANSFPNIKMSAVASVGKEFSTVVFTASSLNLFTKKDVDKVKQILEDLVSSTNT